MPGTDSNHKIVSGDVEIECFENVSLSDEKNPSLANIIASEVVNEILENALDIAFCASQTGIHWKEISSSYSNSSLTANNTSPAIDNNFVNPKQNSPLINQTSNIIIGDILCNSKIQTAIKMSDSTDQLGKQDKVSGGIGDQLNDGKPDSIMSECVGEPEIPRTIERKSRVTDLVKNAPQLITEYLKKENPLLNEDEWEEAEEQFLRIIELDHVKPGDEMFSATYEQSPEDVALPDDENEELDQFFDDDAMDSVDLNPETCKMGEHNTAVPQPTEDGDKDKNDELSSATPRGRASGEETAEVDPEVENKSKPQLAGDANKADSKMKKKKWNIGTRLWGFVKKNHKQHMPS